jgi:hypothetical protein
MKEGDDETRAGLVCLSAPETLVFRGLCQEASPRQSLLSGQAWSLSSRPAGNPLRGIFIVVNVVDLWI